MQKPSKQVSPVLEEHFRFLLWLVPALEKFPKSQRFLLGDRIQTLGQEVLECLIEANYSRERRHHLARANMALDKLRYFIRMAPTGRSRSICTSTATICSRRSRAVVACRLET